MWIQVATLWPIPSASCQLVHSECKRRLGQGWNVDSSLAHFFIVLRGWSFFKVVPRATRKYTSSPSSIQMWTLRIWFLCRMPGDCGDCGDCYFVKAVMSFKTLMPLFAPIPRSKLPTWCQEAFPGATKLNTVQSKAQQHVRNGQTLLDCTRPIWDPTVWGVQVCLWGAHREYVGA